MGVNAPYELFARLVQKRSKDKCPSCEVELHHTRDAKIWLQQVTAEDAGSPDGILSVATATAGIHPSSVLRIFSSRLVCLQSRQGSSKDRRHHQP